MTEQTLTEAEKDALLDGMSSGEVEVQADGNSRLASVQDFVIGPRSRISTNSYPRLNLLNRQFANVLGKQAEQLLNTDTEIGARDTEIGTYTEFCERRAGLSLVVEYSVEPLEGFALIYLGTGIMGHLVESFFGGSGNEPMRQNEDFFTPGERCVAGLFADEILEATRETWEMLMDIQPQRIAVRQSTDLIDGIETTDPVITSEFEMSFGDAIEHFHVLLPMRVVRPLVPVFEGQKRERDPAEDARWSRALRARLPDAVVNISSNVGQAQMSLAEVTALDSGDIITIDNPRKAMIFAKTVPILEGRFGIHDGRHAVETTDWIKPELETAAAGQA